MFNLNRAMIIGNVTRDPEMRYTPNGRAVITFGVATNRRWTSPETGEQQEETEFHDIVAWGKLAEIANQIVRKGEKVYVEGRLRTRSWEGQDGVKRQRTEIIAENIIALSPRPADLTPPTAETEVPAPKETPPPEPKEETKEKKPAKTEEAQKSEEDEEIDLEDIEF